MTEKEESYRRYRASLCVDCGEKRYSAGRPRCMDCHSDYQRKLREDPLNG